MKSLNNNCEKCGVQLVRSIFARRKREGEKTPKANDYLVCGNSDCVNGEKANAIIKK